MAHPVRGAARCGARAAAAARAGAGADRGRRLPRGGGGRAGHRAGRRRRRAGADPPDPDVDLEGRAAALRVHPRPAAGLGRAGSSLVVYGRQIQGALSGWTSSTATNRETRSRRSGPGRPGPWSRWRARCTGCRRSWPASCGTRRPPVLRAERGAGSQCRVRLPAPIEVASSAEERTAFERIRSDEERHTEAFRLLADVLTDDDRLIAGLSARPWPSGSRDQPLVPARRHSDRGRPVPLAGGGGRSGRGPRSWCAAGGATGTRSRCWRSAWTGPGWASWPPGCGWPRSGRRSCSATTGATARTSTTRSSSTRWPGTCGGTAWPTSPCWSRPRSTATCSRTGRSRKWRGTSASPRRPTGSSTSARTCGPAPSTAGSCRTRSAAPGWHSDLRIVMPKLRTDPTEFAHLSLSTLEGSTGAIDETFYAGRRVDFRSATMMLLDVAPRLRGGRRLGAGGRRAVRRDGLPRPGDGPAHLRRRGRPGRGRGGAGRPRRRPIPGWPRSWPRRTTGSAWSPRRSRSTGRAPARQTAARRARLPSASRAGHGLLPYLHVPQQPRRTFVPAMDTAAFPPLTRPGRPPAPCAG